ncbi:MAG TPA: hypothetical protein VD913_04250, partial [bacterium]|nr:hypothetical protein [bacterium]
IVATQGFQSWLRQTVESPSLGESGRAIFDPSWLDRFLEEPRSLYLLFTSLKPYSEEDRRSDPLMAFVGDSLFIKSKIRSELRRQNNGLTAEEKIKANLLLERLDEMVKFLLPEQVTDYVQTQQNGVAILRASHSLISKTPRAAHFILEPQKMIHRRDVPAVALTLPALLKAAALIRGVPPDEQMRILQAHMEEIFPGASGKGEAFVISFADYLAETLQKNGFIATQA